MNNIASSNFGLRHVLKKNKIPISKEININFYKTMFWKQQIGYLVTNSMKLLIVTLMLPALCFATRIVISSMFVR